MTVRPVLHGDLVAAARMLLALAPPERPAAMGALLEAARTADRYRRATGRVHPVHGTGSLMAAAARRPLLPEPWLDDPDYLDCLATVIAALRGRRPAHPAPGGGGAISSGPDR